MYIIMPFESLFQIQVTRMRQRTVKMRFEFLPRKYYKDKYDVRPEFILHHFEEKFLQNVRNVKIPWHLYVYTKIVIRILIKIYRSFFLR